MGRLEPRQHGYAHTACPSERVRGHSFDTPKTSGSRRSVELTVKATEALVRHRDRMRDEGHRASGDALVFVNTLGKPLHSSNFIRRYFKPLLKHVGLPDTNWHAATRPKIGRAGEQ